VEGFFGPLVAHLDRAVAEGFVRAEHRAALTVATDPAVLLERFATYQAPDAGKWVGRDIR
jgi:predicted Rossmann-fold nucleotide-binding protein